MAYSGTVRVDGSSLGAARGTVIQGISDLGIGESRDWGEMLINSGEPNGRSSQCLVFAQTRWALASLESLF